MKTVMSVYGPINMVLRKATYTEMQSGLSPGLKPNFKKVYSSYALYMYV